MAGVRVDDGGSSGGPAEQRFGVPAVELHRVRPAQRLQSALVPRREQRRAQPHGARRGVPAVRAARQELHQRVGAAEKGRTAPGPAELT